MDPTVVIFLLLMYVFQFWMLVDAVRRQEWIWALFIGLALFVWKSWGLSAILYYFLVYRQQAAGPSLSGFELPGTFDRRRIRELEAKILEIHPYDVPEVIALPVEEGSVTYLSWIQEQTRTPAR